MQHPHKFGEVVSIVFVMNICQKAVFTFAGYYAYGKDTNPVLTANLPRVAKLLTSALIVFNTSVSFPLPLVPVFRMFGAAHSTEPGSVSTREAIWKGAVRTAVVLFCGAVAVTVPMGACGMPRRFVASAS